MTREGQDGIRNDAVLMDHSIPVVAYYIDGRYAWTPVEIALFPNSVHVEIAVHSSTLAGHFLDVENGDATPTQAAIWAHNRRLNGYAYPGIYCASSDQESVIQAFDAIGEPLPGWWLAHWDGIDELPPGLLGKQYLSQPNDDRSIWADYIPGVDAAMDQNTLIPFPNADGTVTNVALGTIWENADIYAGRTMNAVNDPNTGLAALSHKIDVMTAAVTSSTQYQAATPSIGPLGFSASTALW